MKNKGGQLTIFIILAILIVAGVALFFVFRSGEGGQSSGSVEVEAIHNHVQGCMDDLLIPGIQLIGIQGGYYYLPDEFLLTEYSSIAYGYDRRKVLVSKEELEKQISYYIEDVAPICVNNEFVLRYSVDIGEPKAETYLQGEKILVKLEFPITLEKGESRSVIKNFKSEIYFNLEDFHDVASNIIDYVSANPDYLDLTYLSGLDYTVSILPYGGSFIYSLQNEDIKLGSEPFIFNFAYRE